MNPGRRDSQLDIWRGLCLVDVVLVHLAYNGLGFGAPLDELIKYYTRFAAGGFVFLAGLTVAAVFGPRVASSVPSRRGAYIALLRRAALLVIIDIAASMAFRSLDVIRWFPFDTETALPDALWQIVTLQRPGLTGGILLFYAIVLAATPLLFEAWRRRGTALIALASLGLYIVAVRGGGFWHWPPNDFPVAYWQGLFAAGFLALPIYQWIRRGAVHRRVAIWVASIGVFAWIFLEHHGGALGVYAGRGFDFNKTPLMPGAFVWYLAIVQVLITTTLLVEARLARSRAGTILALLGRHSLFVYTAHVFTEALVLEIVWGHWPPAALRMALAGGDLLLLLGACWWLEYPWTIHSLASLRARLADARAWPRLAAPALATAALAMMLHTAPEAPSETFETPAATLAELGDQVVDPHDPPPSPADFASDSIEPGLSFVDFADDLGFNALPAASEFEALPDFGAADEQLLQN